MLVKILEILRTEDKPLTLDRLSQIMAVDRSALEGMLNMLVKQQKVQKIEPVNINNEKGSFICKGCQTKAYCAEALKKPTFYVANLQNKA